MPRKLRPTIGQGLLLLALALLASCATRRPPPAPPEAAPAARIEGLEAVGLDQYRTRISFELVLENPRGRAIGLEGYEGLLEIEGLEAGRLAEREARVLEAGALTSIELSFTLDARELDPRISGEEGPAAPRYRIEARAFFRVPGQGPGAGLGPGTGSGPLGPALEARASASGDFPLVREPRLRLLRLRIARDVLVTTRLELRLEAYNPNAFPLELDSLAYRFYGEGKYWAGGQGPAPLSLPPRTARPLDLAFEMNFADRDRALLDLVAELKFVEYRIEGRSTVSTALAFLPDFELAFDEAGRVQVER